MKKHEPYYPVVGGAAECIHCGKQNYNPDEQCERKEEVTDEEAAEDDTTLADRE